MPLSCAPAGGRMVVPFWLFAAFQLSGYAMLKSAPCNRVKLPLGLTCVKETSVAPAALPPVAVPLLPVAFPDTGTLAGIKPFFWFCCAQVPDFAPFAISCAEYAFTLPADSFTL